MPSDNILNILHVEDDLSDAHLIENFLNKPSPANSDYKITHSQTLGKALTELQAKKNFNIILLDLNLPDGLGLKNIEAIKKINSEIPIIVITNAQDPEIASEALRLGAQECIAKAYGNAYILQRCIESSIQRKKAEIELAKKAYYDDLTGLPNRVFFENAARTMIRHAKRWERRDALMFIDLNKFKYINDTYGHEAGNIVLKEVADRLKNTLRGSDLIARYAGDEFVVYLDCGNAPVSEDLCIYLADKITKAAEVPIDIKSEKINISLSIGIAIYPDAGKTLSILLKNADLAMYDAKNNPEISFRVIGENKVKKKSDQNTSTIDQRSLETGKEILLLIDDSALDRKLYKSACENFDHDYKVIEAENAREAFKILEKCMPTCILLDYNLPDSNGIDFLKKYQRVSPEDNAPIIIITGSTSHKTAIESMKNGAKDYIVKGEIDNQRIEQIITGVIEKQSLKKQLREQQKELVRSHNELSDFAQTVAHDLKAPMRKIIMFCDLLGMEDEIKNNENLQEYIARMSLSTERMQALIDSLLTYAQITHSKEERAITSLKAVTEDIVDDLSAWLKENKANITIHDMPSWPVYVVNINQLITNLITNAVKYHHPERDPIVNISAHITGDSCNIIIEDNGMGIPRQHIKKIIKPFHRLQSADKIEGTGLGLAICNKAVQKHGGVIKIESTHGQGSKFIVSLPHENPVA